MERKNDTDEFRQRAVDLFESMPSATLKAVAADLGICRGALKDWVERLESGASTALTSTSDTAVRAGSQSARIRALLDPLHGRGSRLGRAADHGRPERGRAGR